MPFTMRLGLLSGRGFSTPVAGGHKVRPYSNPSDRQLESVGKENLRMRHRLHADAALVQKIFL
ncbi:MAG: hypothetical protein C0518_06615 [Opitutus sp.]|nr:hypothetical protein [Opitutus sp.]